MGLYTRKQYEEDCKLIDAQIAKSATLLGMRLIGPLDHWQRASRFDEQKRRLGQKLAMTALALQDKSNMERSTRFAWVIGAKKNHERGCATHKGERWCNCDGQWFITRKTDPLIKHNAAHYRNTSIMEIQALSNQGVTVMESGFNRRAKKQEEVIDPNAVVHMELEWVEVDKYEMERMGTAGKWVERNGKKDWCAFYMVKSTGEGAEQKFYYCDVRGE